MGLQMEDSPPPGALDNHQAPPEPEPFKAATALLASKQTVDREIHQPPPTCAADKSGTAHANRGNHPRMSLTDSAAGEDSSAFAGPARTSVDAPMQTLGQQVSAVGPPAWRSGILLDFNVPALEEVDLRADKAGREHGRVGGRTVVSRNCAVTGDGQGGRNSTPSSG